MPFYRLGKWNQQTKQYELNQTLLDELMGDAHSEPVLIQMGPISVPAKKPTSMANTWWGKQWVEQCEKDFRYQKTASRLMAKNGAALIIRFSPGEIRGIMLENPRLLFYPNVITITLSTFSKRESKKIDTILQNNPGYLMQMMAGEISQEFADAFQSDKTSLLPTLTFQQKDSHRPADPALAFGYAVGHLIETDPLLLFHIRGKSREQLLGSSIPNSHAPGGITQNSSTPDAIQQFWEHKPGYKQRLPAEPSVPPHVQILANKLSINLAKIYDEATRAAWEKLQEFPNED